ncbi:hypothetical protein QYE76_068165 [Lolium multiflorum]|uniref:Uncharacterized protein n=1 Tax=Lolium multiflorum TaxID=4521 RepID=A0AAD8WCC7_LOLMU|nr:hypothetical protein QYE76_068165 [Lolium multiflorum]
MAKARRELGLLPASGPGPGSPLQLSRQNSGRGGAPSPLSVSSPSSWAQAPAFSRSNGFAEGMAGAGEEMRMSPVNGGAAPFFSRAGNTPVDDFQQQEELAFQSDAGMNPFRTFDGGECRSPGPGDGGMFPYGLGLANGGVPGHRRSASANEACLAGDGFGWKPCLYYARGFCKNGSGCRFVHAGGLPDDDAALAAAAEQQQCQDFLLRSRSQRLGHAAFPYSPTGSLPGSPSAASKCLSFLLQQQHNDNQRAAAALMLGGGGDETHKFMGRPRLDRADFASMMNPGSRQIYLTFPADSTFREEDVSGYFSMYGPVHDVRIPYQQKRMFGFVTFMHPETVRLILAKGNPHFICDARVLVKPYKEKGKIPDKYRKQGDFSGCTTPTGLDGRDPFDLHQLGGRMLQHSNSANELMMRRKLEDEQQAAEFQHAVELQSRRLMSLQLLDLKSRVAAAAAASTAMTPTTTVANASTTTSQPGASTMVESQPDSDQQLNGSNFCANEGGNKEESTDDANRNTDSDQSGDHDLPESPFASSTKSATLTQDGDVTGDGCSPSHNGVCTGANAGGGTNHILPSALDIPSPRPYFFPMSRLSSDHGAIEM